MLYEMIVNYKFVIYLLSNFMSVNCDAISMKKAKSKDTNLYF